MLTKKGPFFNVFLVSFFIMAVLLTARVQATEENHFYFVQITDTHLGDGDHFKRTEKVVRAINRLPMEIGFIVHTGDITMRGIEDEKTMKRGLSIFKKLKWPVYYVSGNHDIIPHKLQSTVPIYKKEFGDLNTAVEYNGVVLLFVYTEPLRESFSIEGQDTVEWLEEQLKGSNDKPVLIFHHAPSVEDFYRNKFHEGWPEKVRRKWKTLINSYNVRAVIAGHFHRDEHHWIGDIPLYVSSPVAGYWGRQATFRIYEYKNGKIGYRTQYIK
ncbi:MAG: metallophosphoesterase [Thermodesulfobacteriota bacterium]|nr:metallophosphoesterase [Thermodesulfobacteriota bacterium]